METKVSILKFLEGKLSLAKHLIIEMYGVSKIDSIPNVKKALEDVVKACGATLVPNGIHLHHFTPYNGISGVAIVSESHISIHTWPEHHYAGLDVYLCGGLDPYKALPILKEAFNPKEIYISEIIRGVLKK